MIGVIDGRNILSRELINKIVTGQRVEASKIKLHVTRIGNRGVEFTVHIVDKDGTVLSTFARADIGEGDWLEIHEVDRAFNIEVSTP